MKKYWLFILIVIQPILDIIAFWSASGSATLAGYIRLFIMLVLVVYTVFTNYENRKLWTAFAIIALVFVAHIVNCFRLGYLNLFGDLSYIAKVVYLPLMTTCFCTLIKGDSDEKQIFCGCALNFIVLTAVIAVSYLTDTYTPTYDGPLGTSGWVINDNRCAHSNLLASVCFITALLCFISKKKWIRFILPPVIAIMLFINGTQSCYLSLMAIMFLLPVVFMLKCLVCGEKPGRLNSCFCCLLFILGVIAAVIYPKSPQYEVSTRENTYLKMVERDFADEMASAGYDVYSITAEDVYEDEFLHEKMKDYYTKRVYGGMPLMIETYDVDRIMQHFNYSVDAVMLEDTRIMNLAYASFIFDDSDTLTKFTGFEFEKIGADKSADVENDWKAVMYYYGYFALSMLFVAVLYLFVREIVLLKNYSKSFCELSNLFIGICFTLQLGLGYFSGAMMRRPNSSIYLALTYAVLYYRTKQGKIDKFS